MDIVRNKKGRLRITSLAKYIAASLASFAMISTRL